MSDDLRRPPHTPIERLFIGEAPKTMGLKTTLEPHFDGYAGLQYMRRTRTLSTAFEVPQVEPGSSWISERLSEFVRGEFGATAGSAQRPPPAEPKFSYAAKVDSREVMRAYLHSCESAVFSGLVDAVARQAGASVIERLYALLTHPWIGNSINAKNLSFESFVEIVGPKIEANERLVFIFPGFPFKDQNRFRTLGPVTEPDLAEAALLIRLHTLSTAIYQVYHMGAEWLVMTDGTAFSDALRVASEDCYQYQSKLVRIRNDLDIGQSVSLVNLRELCMLADEPRGTWDAVESSIQSQLLCGQLPGDAADALGVLARGMKRNVNLRDIGLEVPWAAWWHVTTSGRDACSSEWLEKWDEVEQIAVISAAKYAAFNLTLKWFNVERSVFPEALRATIHPKRGQLAVPRIGSEFPWNGTAFVNGPVPSYDSVSCLPLREIADRGRIQTHLSDSGSPFFCTINEN